MTLKHRIYFRKDGDKYKWEGKMKGKTEFLIQKPSDDEKFLRIIGRLVLSFNAEQQKIAESPFFDKEKWLLILEKMNRLDFRRDKLEKDD